MSCCKAIERFVCKYVWWKETSGADQRTMTFYSSYREAAMSHQCQNKKFMCVVQKAATRCLSDSSGTYFICSFCMHRTYLAELTPRAILSARTFDRRAAG